MIITEQIQHDKWQTYPYHSVALGNYKLSRPGLIPIEAESLEITGVILSIKDRVFRMELDTKSLQLVLKVAKTVNQRFSRSTGNKLESINVFDAGILRFRRREGNSVFNRFNSLIGSNVKIVIKPESVYQGKHFSLNWVCESF